MGDGVLVEFASAVNAVECAARATGGHGRRQRDCPTIRRIVLRIGINLGDVMVEGGDLYGDGVNIAARLEVLAEPGGVFISQTVFSHVRGKADLDFEDLGEQSLKNMAEPGAGLPAMRRFEASTKTRPRAMAYPPSLLLPCCRSST